jgi:hypothetical protein
MFIIFTFYTYSPFSFICSIIHIFLFFFFLLSAASQPGHRPKYKTSRVIRRSARPARAGPAA